MPTPPLTPSASFNLRAVRGALGDSFDLVIRELTVAGTKAYALCFDGLCDELRLTEAVLRPLTDASLKKPSGSLAEEISERLYQGTDCRILRTVSEACQAALGGCLVLLPEGEAAGLSFPLQGFPKRAVDRPQSEQNEKGGQEAFTDNFKDNTALLRRRLRTPDLRLELLTLGDTSRTPVALCFLRGRADEAMLEQVRRRLQNARLDTALGAGYLRPFLEGKRPSLFRGTGVTERPDTLAAMLAEGRVGVIVDGSPYAIVAPWLFSDHFHTADDYLSGPLYATFMRALRVVCAVIATALPGCFVAVCLFHPEIIPADIMFDIAEAESKTPFPLMTEALVIHLIYEAVREAGLRMPVAVGHAVSIVGALVIGETAVRAGLIGAPMLIVVALTAVCSSVAVRLHEPVSLIRFAMILAGGLAGLYGLMLLAGLLLTDLCAVAPFGVPYSAPVSPFVRAAQRDTVWRAGWRKLGRRVLTVKEMKFE